MPKKREHIIWETSDPGSENIARLTREMRHSHANLKHRRDLDPDEFEELVEIELGKKGQLEVIVESRTRQPENVICYFLCLAAQGKAQVALDAYLQAWQ